ncbi:MAG: PIN domain-containing protein [Sulfurovum sp.]|nr:PIN domain-containing protein [Sulfurovaceae bacterium]
MHQTQRRTQNYTKNLKFLSRYVKPTDINIHIRVIDIFEKTNLYKSSFDIFHLAFCEENDCKLITFDKGFKKLQELSKIEIDIK